MENADALSKVYYSSLSINCQSNCGNDSLIKVATRLLDDDERWTRRSSIIRAAITPRDLRNRATRNDRGARKRSGRWTTFSHLSPAVLFSAAASRGTSCWFESENRFYHAGKAFFRSDRFTQIFCGKCSEVNLE